MEHTAYRQEVRSPSKTSVLLGRDCVKSERHKLKAKTQKARVYLKNKEEDRIHYS